LSRLFVLGGVVGGAFVAEFVSAIGETRAS
jgi:hypothetical protein